MGAVVGSILLIGHPFIADYIIYMPPPEDERFQPMNDYVPLQFLTIAMTCVFEIMFVSNLIVAAAGREFGTLYVLFNFVFPYAALVDIGVVSMPYVPKRMWYVSAKETYGENWEEVLFGNAEIAENFSNTAEEKEEQNDHEHKQARRRPISLKLPMQCRNSSREKY
jgi:hypothetical protein